jgi:hypothetical protein
MHIPPLHISPETHLGVRGQHGCMSFPHVPASPAPLLLLLLPPPLLLLLLAGHAPVAHPMQAAR